jgi:integrative and conjugative element protein (TIGR02256 family)
MPFLNIWSNPRGDRLVFFSSEVLAIFDRYIQDESDPEAGGILLGHVRGVHLEILEATVPTPKDRRLKYLFERFTYGHQKIARRRWRESGGLVRYVGEWHTHPEDHPTPSATDTREWLRLARDRRDGRPLLTTIVGRQSLRVEFMQASGARQRLYPAQT